MGGLDDGVRVVGLDLSLTSTGLSDGARHGVVTTAAGERLEARLDHLVRRVVQFTVGLGNPARLAVIEAPAWSRAAHTGHEELSALRVMVRHRLWRLGIPYAMVPPSTLKRAVTGYGSAAKSDVVSALDAAYGTDFASVKVRHGRYDMADAFGLAAMGYQRAGFPLPHQGPGLLTASVDAVSWPMLLSD